MYHFSNKAMTTLNLQTFICFSMYLSYICFCTTLYHVMFLSKMLSTFWSKRTKYTSIIHKLVERKKVVVHFRIPFIDFLQLNICYFPDRNGPLSQFIAPLSFFFQCSTLLVLACAMQKGLHFEVGPSTL